MIAVVFLLIDIGQELLAVYEGYGAATQEFEEILIELEN